MTRTGYTALGLLAAAALLTGCTTPSVTVPNPLFAAGYAVSSAASAVGSGLAAAGNGLSAVASAPYAQYQHQRPYGGGATGYGHGGYSTAPASVSSYGYSSPTYGSSYAAPGHTTQSYSIPSRTGASYYYQ